MASLERALNQRRRRSPLLYVGASVFVAGVALVGVGTLAVLRDLLAPVTTVTWTWSVVTTGLLLPLLLYTVASVIDDSGTGRLGLAGLTATTGGVVVYAIPAAAGLGGTILPVSQATAGLLYVVGLSVLVVTFFSVAIDRRLDVPSIRHSTNSTGPRSRNSLAGPVTADGGDDENDLEFLLDDEDDDRS